MPIRYLTADQVRHAEHARADLLEAGILMRRAAFGVATVVAGELSASGGVYGRRVGLVVGSGDNGGDALFAGATLARRGVRCDALLLAPEKTHTDALSAYRHAGGRVVKEFSEAMDLVIDGVVGIGGHGPLRPAAAAVFADVTAPVVAVDVPSGVDADTGEVHEPAVAAAVTVTFGFPRRAHLLAAPRCGRVEIIDIGIGGAAPGIGDAGDPDDSVLGVLTDGEVASRWPIPGPTDDKYTQGVVGVIAGSATYPGAALLATGAAVAATSGMTRYVGTAADEVVSHHPEVVAVTDLADAGRVQAWTIGPGIGTDDHGEQLVREILSTDLPVLLDADALTIVARHRAWVADRAAPTLLTPHAGEFARLTGAEVGADRAGAVVGLAREVDATVLLKGRITLVADPSGRMLGNDAQASWAATAGAGDVLSGIAGALLAAGLRPLDAGAAAARVHAASA
ncbi:bifunctional ADP-dependent NAD(P)H-hydrate dehydratase/NAD(P)H-hydrate epimerase, partial [Gordonia soli]